MHISVDGCIYMPGTIRVRCNTWSDGLNCWYAPTILVLSLEYELALNDSEFYSLFLSPATIIAHLLPLILYTSSSLLLVPLSPVLLLTDFFFVLVFALVSSCSRPDFTMKSPRPGAFWSSIKDILRFLTFSAVQDWSIKFVLVPSKISKGASCI